MEFHVTFRPSRKLSDDVYEQLKAAILDGRFEANQSLPSTRELATRLSVSRNTILNAFRRLTVEGFLSARVGAGTFVNPAATTRPRRAPAKPSLQPRKLWSAMAPAGPARPTSEFDFRLGVPDPTHFPGAEWRSIVARVLRGRKAFAGYAEPQGDQRLRAAIARHLGLSRSVVADADDVLVCNGSQQAFDLIAHVLVEPGTCVAVEDPGYPSFRHLMQLHGARVVPVRVDEEGIDVAALPEDARLVYVTPSHQYPLGVRMSLARRMELLAWSERRGAAIVEDDYDSELRFDGRPVEPLQSLDRSGRVLYVGTFSKVLSPTLRLGFLVSPPSLMPSLRRAKRLIDSHSPLDFQQALATLLDEEIFARHVRRLLRVYGERRERLLAALDRELGDEVVAIPSTAGLHCSVYCRERGLDVEEWARRALRARVTMQPLGPYFQLHPRAAIGLGYGLIPTSKIDEGIARLAASKPGLARARPRRRTARVKER